MRVPRYIVLGAVTATINLQALLWLLRAGLCYEPYSLYALHMLIMRLHCPALKPVMQESYE